MLLFLGTVLYFLCHLSLPFLDWSALVYVQRFGLGLLMGVTGTVTGTVMAYSLPPAVQGLGVSIFSLSTAIALALGPFIGLTVVHLAGYNVLNWDTTILSLVAVVAGLCLKQAPDIQTGRKSFFQLSNYLDRDVLPFAMVAVIMTLGYGSLASYLATIAAERHLETAASIFFLVSAIVTIVTRPFTGRFFDRFGENFVIYPAIFCTAVALSLVAVAQSPWLLLVAGVFQGLGFGNFQSAGQALAIKLVAKPRIAQATSTFFIAFDLGMGLSPYIFGFIGIAFGFTVMLLSLSVCTALGLGVYYLVHGRSHPLKRPLFKHKSQAV